MPFSVYFLAFIGLAGIVGGIFALRAAKRFSLSGLAPKRWHMYRMIAIVLGVICGVASWPLTYVMGYRFETPEGIGRIVGIPFMVAFFDSRGRDLHRLIYDVQFGGKCILLVFSTIHRACSYGRQYRKLMK